MDITTREIMWNIPAFMKTSMYVFFAASLVVMVQGFHRKFRSVGLGQLKNWRGLAPQKFNWSNFIKTILLQGKIPRNKMVGIVHALIFYGFVILWIATDLVAIHADTPFKIYQGNLYIVVSFLADMAGIMILLGIGAAFYRRYYLRPDYLSATHPNRELYMYSMLIALVVLGYALEAFRIEGTRNAFLAGEEVLFSMKENEYGPPSDGFLPMPFTLSIGQKKLLSPSGRELGSYTWPIPWFLWP